MTSKPGSIPFGVVDVPKGWRVTTEIVMTEEVTRQAKAPLHPGTEAEQYPANLTIARESVDAKLFSIERELNNFLGELADSSSGFEVLEECAVEFRDGVKGLGARVRYDLAPGLSVLQHHAMRIDGSVVTRLMTSVDVRRADQLKDLDALVRSFRPLTGSS